MNNEIKSYLLKIEIMTGSPIKYLLLILVLLGSSKNLFSQFHSKESVINRLHSSVSILNNQSKIQNKNSVDKVLRELSFGFCYSKKYNDELKSISSDSIFNIIQLYKDTFLDVYLHFARSRVHCFSSKEYEIVRNSLRNLKEIPFAYYDLIGLYQLKKFEPLLREKISEDWYNNMSSFFEKDWHSLNRKLLKDAIVYTTLANLGDTLIEQRIIKIIYNQAKYFAQDSKGKAKEVKLDFFYRAFLKATLGNLYSKESLISTLSLLDNYDKADFSDDAVTSPMYIYYLDAVVIKKLEPLYIEMFRFQYMLPMYAMTLDEKKVNIQNIKNMIIEGKVVWSNIYNLWENNKN